MRAIFFAVCTLIVCALSSVAGANIPGKVAIWSSAEKKAESATLSHITKSAAPADVIHALRTAAVGNKNVVVLTSSKDSAGKSSILTADAVAQSVKSSHAAQVLTNVYHAQHDSAKALSEHIRSAEVVQDIQKHTLQEAVERLEAGAQNAHFMEVAVDSADTAHHALLHRLFAAARQHADAHSTLFVAVDEPSADAVMPTENGEYSRLLTETPRSRKTARTTGTASASSAPIAGAEFSIYYEGTYLYITPDLFTGIMTALFMVFVVLTGFSCMGSIQGMSTFYDRVPTNGREA
jgi:hypothetical protein